MKRLKDLNITKRIPRPSVKVMSMQFGDNEATRRIAIHHAKHVIHQPKGEIQKLTYK